MKLNEFFKDFNFDFSRNGVVEFYKHVISRDSLLKCVDNYEDLRNFLSEHNEREVLTWGVSNDGYYEETATLIVVLR